GQRPLPRRALRLRRGRLGRHPGRGGDAGHAGHAAWRRKRLLHRGLRAPDAGRPRPPGRAARRRPGLRGGAVGGAPGRDRREPAPRDPAGRHDAARRVDGGRRGPGRARLPALRAGEGRGADDPGFLALADARGRPARGHEPRVLLAADAALARGRGPGRGVGHGGPRASRAADAARAHRLRRGLGIPRGERRLRARADHHADGRDRGDPARVDGGTRWRISCGDPPRGGRRLRGRDRGAAGGAGARRRARLLHGRAERRGVPRRRPADGPPRADRHGDRGAHLHARDRRLAPRGHRGGRRGGHPRGGTGPLGHARALPADGRARRRGVELPSTPGARVRRLVTLLAGLALAAPAALAAQARTHVLIVVGLGGTAEYREAFHDQAVRLSGSLVEHHGVAAEDVTYLGERVEVAPDVIDGRATKDGVLEALTAIAGRAGAADRVLVVLFGHGTTGSGGTAFNLSGPDLGPADLAP